MTVFGPDARVLVFNSLPISVLNINLVPCLGVVQILVNLLSHFSGVQHLLRKFADCLQPLCRICDGGLMVGCGFVDSVLLLFSVECKWLLVSMTAPWFMGSFWKCYCTTHLCQIFYWTGEITIKTSLSTSAFQCYVHFTSNGKLWEGDHHSGCPSASLAKKTCSMPWSIQIVNNMRDGEVRNRTVIAFHKKFVHVCVCVCVCARICLCVQNSLLDLSRILSGNLWCLQEALQNK